MPFVPFTGVNHHYQSVIFGYALMRDENATTFEWVLRTWVEAVGYKYPMIIITDQDLAMEKAIACVLPETNHLLCWWHISNKFSEKLLYYYAMYETFQQEFNECIYKSITPEVFEERWAKFVVKYKLEDRSWLQSMYGLRRKWARAYTLSYFAANQTTTGRSEGMNAYFDMFVSSTTGMRDFVKAAQKALERQFMREKEEDYYTSHRKRGFKLQTALEYNASTIYTREIFIQFQSELVESSKYSIVRNKEYVDPERKMYQLFRPLMDPSMRITNFVLFNKYDCSGSCICHKFDHLGIPCHHILAVLQKHNIVQISEVFVLDRWRANANRVDGVLSPTLKFTNMSLASLSFC